MEKIKLNYFFRNETNRWISETRNGRKKTIITYYSKISPKTMLKSYQHHYCSKNATTPIATKFTLLTQGSYKLGGDSVVYTSNCDGLAHFHH